MQGESGAHCGPIIRKRESIQVSSAGRSLHAIALFYLTKQFIVLPGAFSSFNPFFRVNIFLHFTISINTNKYPKCASFYHQLRYLIATFRAQLLKIHQSGSPKMFLFKHLLIFLCNFNSFKLLTLGEV